MLDVSFILVTSVICLIRGIAREVYGCQNPSPHWPNFCGNFNKNFNKMTVKCVSVKRPCPQNPLPRPFLATSLCLITLVPACLLGLTKTNVTLNSLIQLHLKTNWARPHTPVCRGGGTNSMLCLGHQRSLIRPWSWCHCYVPLSNYSYAYSWCH